MNPVLVLLFTWNLLLMFVWCPPFILQPTHMVAAFQQFFLQPDFSLTVLINNWIAFGTAGIGLAGMLGASWLAGGPALRLFSPALSHGVLPRLGAGLFLASTGALGAGLSGLLFAPPPWILLPLLALAGGWAAWRGRRDIREIPSRFPGLPALTLLTIGVLALSGIVVLAGLLNVEMSWDALTYHLRLPSFYNYRHKFYDVWHHYCAPFPFAIEMGYSLALLAQGELLARFLNGAYSVLLLATLAGLAREVGIRGSWALLLMSACPLFLVLFDRAYIDPGFAFFVSLSLMLFARWWRTGSTGDLCVSGFCAGAGLSCKYTGIFFIAAIISAGFPRLKDRAGRRAALLFAAAALAPFLPWLVKNFLFRANPVFPYLGGVFGTQTEIPSDVTPFFDQANPLLSWLSQLPKKLVALVLDHGRVDGPLLPIIAGFLPLLAKKPATAALAMLRRAAFGYLALWFILAPDVRFLLPILPAICILLEAAAVSLMETGRIARSLVRAFLEAGLVLGAWSGLCIQWVFFAPFSMLFGLESAQTKLEIGLTPPPFTSYAKDYVNSNTPKDARIMFLSHFSTYYYERECLAEFPFAKSQLTRILLERRTAAEIGKRFKQLGIRWLLYTGPGADQYVGIPGYFDVPQNIWREWKRLLSERSEAAWQTDGYTLYRLGNPHPPRPLPAIPILDAILFQDVDRALAEGRPLEALNLLRKISPLMRDVGSTWLRLGDAHHLLGDFGEAAAALSRAVELGVDTPRLHLGLAHALLLLGRAPEAVPHAERAWSQNPLSAYTAGSAASVQGSVGNIIRARQLIKEALRLRPGDEGFLKIARHVGLPDIPGEAVSAGPPNRLNQPASGEIP